MLESKINIVGIGGLARSGKDALAELFKSEGYFGISAGDLVRNFTKKRHAKDKYPISRVNTTETSNWLRATKGANFYIEESIKAFNQAIVEGKSFKGLVVWSIRASAEVDYILGKKGKLIWVEVDDEVRLKRHLKHLRDGESLLSLKEFLAQEAPQWKPQPGIPASIQMNVSYVKDHATNNLLNNGDDLNEFYSRAKTMIEAMNLS